jgi:cell wall-associated NlpC family hydrolase
VPRTWGDEGADLKGRAVGALSLGSSLQVESFVEHRGTRYAVAADGTAVVAGHVRPLAEHAADYVSVAELLLNTPYLWGGASAFGIDCSGLVQLSMRMAGRDVPRDSDMQAAALGVPIDPSQRLRRGDLVFWKGHVAILTGDADIIHANGHTMLVSIEPLKQAIKRIGYLYGEPTGYRRP